MNLKLFLLILIWSFIHPLYSQNLTINISPSQTDILPGEAASFNITINNPGSFNQQLFFNISYTTLPATMYGISFTPNPINYPFTGGTILNVTTSGSIALGNYILVVTASNGPFNVSDTCEININEPDCFWTSFQFPNNYDPSYYLTIDHNDNKWMPAFGGLLKFDGITWTKYTPSNSNIPPSGFGIGKIQVDNQNNIWIPNQSNGLVKFDGIFWTVYNMSNSPIPSNNINALAIDSSGNKWISTADAGISKFDGVLWTNYNASNSPLPYNNIRDIKFDKTENLWMVCYSSSSALTGGILIKFDGINWIVYNSSSSCFTNNCRISNLAFDQYNNLWFCAGISSQCSGPTVGVVKFDGNNWETWLDSLISPNHIIKDMNCNIITQNNQSKLPKSFNREIFIDPYNNAWIASLDDLPGVGNGITRFDGTNWKTFNQNNSNLPKKAIRGIDFKNDSLWVVASPDFYNNSSPNYLAAFNCNTLTSHSELSSLEETFKIYPNPSNDIIKINSNLNKISEVKIYDVVGKLIKGELLNENNEIDISQLNPGIYFVKVITDKQEFVSKLIKQ